MNILLLLLITVVVAQLAYVTRKINVKSVKKSQHPVFVDTSVLIDGRILAIAASGFIRDTLYIPRSVIGELQFLADNADADKRARARHGLDVVKQLQELSTVEAEIFQDGSKADEGVDERLLKLAKDYDGAVCTIDFNLNKVASVEDIQVLNVNELAQNLRATFLPGETTTIHLLQKGQDAHQAVGYLDDGTMVVVEQANKLIGQAATVEFIRSLQTAAGKMMFAKLVDGTASNPPTESTAQPKGRAPKVFKKHDSSSPRKQSKQSHQSKQRPKTSSQREASLIELVNQQASDKRSSR